MKNLHVGLVFTVFFNCYSHYAYAVNSESESDGSSNSIYDTLKGFVNELGTVVKDVRIGIDKVASGIQSVEELLDATLDEECVHECSKAEIMYPNPDHVPSSNGCGSFGLENFLTKDMIPFLEQFIDCCEEHDICYGTCLNDKDVCDLKFRKCLYRKCSSNVEATTLSNKLKQRGCKAGAKLLYTGTASLGCKPFINAQKEACRCKNQNKRPNKDEF